MPKRSSTAKPKPKQPATRDFNQTAYDAVQQVIALTEGAEERQEKNPAAVALGRLGGLKGGPARAAALSETRRRDIATKAAKKRWGAR